MICCCLGTPIRASSQPKFGAAWIKDGRIVGAFLEGGTGEENKAIAKVARAQPSAEYLATAEKGGLFPSYFHVNKFPLIIWEVSLIGYWNSIYLCNSLYKIKRSVMCVLDLIFFQFHYLYIFLGLKKKMIS